MTGRLKEQQARAGSLPSIPVGADVHGVDRALDVMEVGVFEWDVATGIHRFSERCKRIWGFNCEDELTPEMILGRVHPDDLHLQETVRSALAPDGPGCYSIEHRVVLPDGTIRWVLVCGKAKFIDSDGTKRAVHGYGAMRDITDRKLADQQLYERNSQLRTFVEGAPVPLAIFDREMRYLAVSDRYAEDRYLDPANLIGRSAYEVFADMPERLRAVHRRILNGATDARDKDLWVRPDGTREWIRWEMRPWYRAENEIGGAILFSEFITRRIKEQHALRDSQARLELATRAGALGVYDHDFTTGRLTWDATLRKLWGFGPDEPITYDMFLEGVHPEDREKVASKLRQACAARDDGLVMLEHRIVSRADGSIHWVAATGRVYFADHVRSIGIVQDITERKRAELALKQSAEELRLADERKNVYLATLSHELRNPLAPIRTAAHLLDSPKLTPEQLAWISQVIRRQAGRMASLLEDLLEVTRICRGKLVLKKERVLLSSIAQSAIESVRPLLDEKHHRLLVSLPTDQTLYADPLRLSQVLSNLLTNAAKYTDPGGQIELTAQGQQDGLVIRVKDNGIGIPREAIDKIFTMFWQADSGSGHSQGGLGIGLAFAQGIVRLHGGSIEARSEGPHRGSELIIHLPLLERPPQASADTSALACPNDRPVPAHHRILVADDDNDTADTLEMLLTFSNHEVRVARTGQEALAAAHDFRPDVALLDLGMPGLDGYAVAQLLRKQPWASGIRLIALTGWGQPDDRYRATEAGFDEQLIKPIDPESLRKILNL